jgi:hypothetical protein
LCSCFRRAGHIARQTFDRHSNFEDMITSLMSVALSVSLFLFGVSLCGVLCFVCLVSGGWCPRTTVYDAQTYHALHPVPPHCAPPRPTAHHHTLPALSPTTKPDIHRRRHRETSNFCSWFQRSNADQECAGHVAQHTFIRHFNVENMNKSLISVSLSVCLFLSGDRRNTYHATKDEMCKLTTRHNIAQH